MMWFNQPGGFGYGYGMMGGFGWLFMFLVVVGVIAFVVVLRGRSRDDGRKRSTPDIDALDILDARYARGEIDSNEYKKRRADLDR